MGSSWALKALIVITALENLYMTMSCLFTLHNYSEKVKLFTLINEETKPKVREKSNGFVVSIPGNLEIA